MSLAESIEELKKEIAAREEGHKEENEEDGLQEENQEDAAEEEVADEEPKKEAQKEEEKPVLDDAGYARLRREKAAAERLAQERERELEELRQSLAEKQSKAEEAPQDNGIDEVLEEVSRIKQERLISDAEKEILAFERAVAAKEPDYVGVASAYTHAIYNSIKTLNPDLPEQELARQTKMKILTQAADLLRAGYENPAEELYRRAKEAGFKAPAPQKEEQLRPDMNVVAKNRARSAGTAAASGKSEGNLTRKYAATEMTASEWVNLSSDEKKRLMRGQ